MSNFLLPHGAWAQNIAVPFGRTAQFGLLSGGNITTDTTAVAAWGKAGATGSISPHLTATDSVLTQNAGTVSGALADLQAAITYCQSLTAQAVTPASIAKPTPAGVYQFSSSITLDSASQLHLYGTANTWHIFRINGNLTVTSGGGVTMDESVRPDHIIWQVTGAVTQEPLASLPGIVLAGGNATITDVQFGAQALLTLGNIHFTDQERTLGRAAYVAATLMGGPPSVPPGSCGSATICDPELGMNLLGNSSAEYHIPQLWDVISNMVTTNSNVNCWESTLPNVMSPDYFNTKSSGTDVGIPTNLFGGQNPRNSADHGYMGLYAAARRARSNDGVAEYRYLHDYIRQPFADLRLTPGQWYYGEFYVSLAEISALPMFPSQPAPLEWMGMYLANEEPPARWFDNRATGNRRNQSGQMRIVPPGGTYANSPAAVAQIRWAEAPLTTTSAWVRVAGCFQATGLERCAVIGSFRDWVSDGIANAGQYYYLDDLSMSAYPEPTVDQTVVECSDKIRLDIKGCALPKSSGAEYRWTSDTGFDSGYQSTPLAVCNPTQLGTYFLSVRVPVPGQTTTFPEVITGQVRVEVAAPRCQLDCQANVIESVQLLFPDFKIPGGYTFPEHMTYYADQNVLLTGGIVTVPEGTVLLMNTNTRIDLENATLLVEGGTITTACASTGLWDGIYAHDANSGVQTNTSPNDRQPEISGMTNGIVLNANPTTTGWFQLTQTLFRNNLRTLSSHLPATVTTPAPAGSITNCTFDADPAMLNGQYPLWYVSLSGDRRTTIIHDNTFDHAWFGLYAPQVLRIGSATTNAYQLHHNTFHNQYLAGIYAAARPASTTDRNELRLNDNTFEFSTDANVPLGTNETDALALVTAVEPAHLGQFQNSVTDVISSFGVFTENVTLNISKNTFHQSALYPDYDYAAVRNRQVGAYANIAPAARIETNDFVSLHEGLVGLYAPLSFIQNNLFDNCKIGAHVLAAPSGATSNPVCLDCNTFQRGHSYAPNFPYSVSYGVLIDQNASVKLARHNATGTNSDRVLGNYFYHDGLTIAQHNGNFPTATPTFTGFNNAIVNNSTGPLGYLTYDDDILTSPTDLLLDHAPAAVLGDWPGNNNYYGSTNVVVTTPASATVLPYRVTSVTDCASRGLGFTRGLLERSVSTSNPSFGVIKRQANALLLSCFPNPAEDNTTANYALPLNSKSARLDVRDLMGRVVLTHSLDLQTKDGQAQIILSTAPSGILICQLVVDGTVRASQRLAHGPTTFR